MYFWLCLSIVAASSYSILLHNYPANEKGNIFKLNFFASLVWLVILFAFNKCTLTLNREVVLWGVGDDEWLKKVLPSLEKGIDYITSNPKRWDESHGLVKRPFTIDTWDFTYNTSPINRRIEETTPMSIMHGDNSGVFAAMHQLAWFNRRLNNEEKAREWERRAEELRQNMFKY